MTITRLVLGCLLAATAIAPASKAAILWKGDYSTGNLTQWSKTQAQSADRLSVVSSPVHGGQYALRAELHQGDYSSSGCRAEVVRSVPELEGAERYYAWSTLFPNEFPHSLGWQVFTQWHHGGTGSPPLEFDLVDERMQLSSAGSTIHWTTPLVRGVWHDFVFHVKFSSSAAVGFIELWYDGQKVIPKKPWATQYPGTVSYLKEGLYRKPTIAEPAVIYQAGMIEGETLADVAPALAGSGPPAPAPGFALSLGPSSQTVLQGQSASYAVALARTGGFADIVTYSVSGLPIGVTASIATASSGATLTLSAAAGAAAGSFAFTLAGTAKGTTHTAAGMAIVIAAPPPPPPMPSANFTISLGPATQSVMQGQAGEYTVAIARTGGHTGAINLIVQGLPEGVTAAITETTLAVAVGKAAAPGTATLTVVATSQGLSRTAAATLVIAQPAPTPDSAPDFSLSTGEANQAVHPGETAVYAVQLLRSSGFAEAIELGVSGLPPGAQGSFRTSDAGATLAITAPLETPAGSYALLVTGTAASRTRTAPATLEVIAATGAPDTNPGGAPPLRSGGCSSAGQLSGALPLLLLALFARRKRPA